MYSNISLDTLHTLMREAITECNHFELDIDKVIMQISIANGYVSSISINASYNPTHETKNTLYNTALFTLSESEQKEQTEYQLQLIADQLDTLNTEKEKVVNILEKNAQSIQCTFDKNINKLKRALSCADDQFAIDKLNEKIEWLTQKCNTTISHKNTNFSNLLLFIDKKIKVLTLDSERLMSMISA